MIKNTDQDGIYKHTSYIKTKKYGCCKHKFKNKSIEGCTIFTAMIKWHVYNNVHNDRICNLVADYSISEAFIGRSLNDDEITIGM